MNWNLQRKPRIHIFPLLPPTSRMQVTGRRSCASPWSWTHTWPRTWGNGRRRCGRRWRNCGLSCYLMPTRWVHRSGAKCVSWSSPWHSMPTFRKQWLLFHFCPPIWQKCVFWPAITRNHTGKGILGNIVPAQPRRYGTIPLPHYMHLRNLGQTKLRITLAPGWMSTYLYHICLICLYHILRCLYLLNDYISPRLISYPPNFL